MFQLDKLLKIKWGLGFDLKIVKNQIRSYGINYKIISTEIIIKIFKLFSVFILTAANCIKTKGVV